MDCYGDPAVTGKIGTDIQDNKCSWLVVKALEVMSPEQRTVLEVRLLKLSALELPQQKDKNEGRHSCLAFYDLLVFHLISRPQKPTLIIF